MHAMMNVIRHFTLTAGGTICLATAAQAQVSVDDAWVRATVPQQKTTGAFMTLRSASNAKLVAVHTDAAEVAEVHEMAMDGSIMRMRQVTALPLPAGKAVALQPG